MPRGLLASISGRYLVQAAAEPAEPDPTALALAELAVLHREPMPDLVEHADDHAARDRVLLGATHGPPADLDLELPANLP